MVHNCSDLSYTCHKICALFYSFLSVLKKRDKHENVDKDFQFVVAFKLLSNLSSRFFQGYSW